LTSQWFTCASREKWIPAIRATYRYLSKREDASKQDFIDDVYPDEQAGATTKRPGGGKSSGPD
jgi:hypothetical protein